jgi:hypothetical protein
MPGPLKKHFCLPPFVHLNLETRPRSGVQPDGHKILALLVFSKGSETSDLPLNLHFSSKQLPSTMRTAWHLVGKEHIRSLQFSGLIAQLCTILLYGAFIAWRKSKHFLFLHIPECRLSPVVISSLAQCRY